MSLDIFVMVDTIVLITGVVVALGVSMIMIKLMNAMVTACERVASQTGEIVRHQAHLDAQVSQAAGPPQPFVR